MNPITLAQALPAKVRVAIYSILPTLVALEAVFDWIEGDIESKVLAVLVIFGFGTALSNTPPVVARTALQVPPEFPDEFP